MEALIFKNATVAYYDKIIFSHFTAGIKQGEFIGVFGPNGAGKSTLFRTILGLIPIKSGELLLYNKKVHCGLSVIGYMPQNRNLVMPGLLSGRARLQICVNGYKWGLPNIKQSTEEVDHLIHLVEAESFADKPFYQLSGGEKQRLLFAQALLSNPTILLLDEPLLNLDPYHQEKMIELVAKTQKQMNMTVLLSSHAINPLLNVMDRIIYLARGNAAIGTVPEVINTDKLSWLYGYPIEVIQHGHRLFIIGQDTEIQEHDAHH